MRRTTGQHDDLSEKLAKDQGWFTLSSYGIRPKACIVQFEMLHSFHALKKDLIYEKVDSSSHYVYSILNDA